MLSALYAHTTTDTFGYSASVGSSSVAYQRWTAANAGSGEPLVREREGEGAGRAQRERRPHLPGERRRLLLRPLAAGVHAEFGQHERPVAGQRVQPIEISDEVFLAMQIDVEREEIGEVGFEIFGGREIRVADEPLGIAALDDLHQLAQEGGDAPGAVPADDVRGDLVADQQRGHRRMVLACLSRPPERVADLAGQLLRIEEAHVLGPRHTDEHAKTALRGQIEQPARRDGERPERVGAELGHEAEIGLDLLRVWKLIPAAIRGEGAVGDTVEPDLLGPGEEKLAARLEPLAAQRAGLEPAGRRECNHSSLHRTDLL